MGEYSMVPAIRVRDMEAGLRFYRDQLGFKLERGGAEEDNVALSLGDARIMLDRVPTEFYSPEYNDRINARSGQGGQMALYIEAVGLDDFYGRVQGAGVTVVDPIADRPWGQREFTVEDLEGNWLSFWEALKSG